MRQGTNQLDDHADDITKGMETLQSKQEKEQDILKAVEWMKLKQENADWKTLITGPENVVRDGHLALMPTKENLGLSGIEKAPPGSAKRSKSKEKGKTGAKVEDKLPLVPQKPQADPFSSYSVRCEPWKPRHWLEARQKVLDEGRLGELPALMRAVRISTDQAVKDRQYDIFDQHKRMKVDLSQIQSSSEKVKWLGQFNIVVPRMPSATSRPVIVEPPIIVADMSPLDIFSRIIQSKDKDEINRPIYVVVEVRQFDATGNIENNDSAPSMQNLFLRTDLARYFKTAEVDVRAGRSTVRDHLMAASDPYMFVCPDVTVFRGLREDGFPFVEKPRRINCIVSAMTCAHPVMTASTNWNTGEKTEWYRKDDDQTALLERLSLLGCAALQDADPKNRPILILTALGCNDRGTHPRDAVANSLKHWRQRFSRLFHTVYLSCGSDADLAATMDIAINGQVYASLLTHDVSDFCEWHWDPTAISMHVSQRDLFVLGEKYNSRQVRRHNTGQSSKHDDSLPSLDTTAGFGKEDNSSEDKLLEAPRRQSLLEILGGARIENAAGDSLYGQDRSQCNPDWAEQEVSCIYQSAIADSKKQETEKTRRQSVAGNGTGAKRASIVDQLSGGGGKFGPNRGRSMSLTVRNSKAQQVMTTTLMKLTENGKEQPSGGGNPEPSYSAKDRIRSSVLNFQVDKLRDERMRRNSSCSLSPGRQQQSTSHAANAPIPVRTNSTPRALDFDENDAKRGDGALSARRGSLVSKVEAQNVAARRFSTAPLAERRTPAEKSLDIREETRRRLLARGTAHAQGRGASTGSAVSPLVSPRSGDPSTQGFQASIERTLFGNDGGRSEAASPPRKIEDDAGEGVKEEKQQSEWQVRREARSLAAHFRASSSKFWKKCPSSRRRESAKSHGEYREHEQSAVATRSSIQDGTGDELPRASLQPPEVYGWLSAGGVVYGTVENLEGTLPKTQRSGLPGSTTCHAQKAMSRDFLEVGEGRSPRCAR